MKLYDLPIAPNPKRVNIFLSEKGIEVERVMVDFDNREQLSEAYIAKNPAGDIPMLELDDGTCISQVNAICRYFEEIQPEPPLFGSSATEKATVDMWNNIVAQDGLIAVAEVFRNTSEAFKDRALIGKHNYAQLPELAERGRKRIANFFQDMDQRLANIEYVAGDSFSIVDILALVTIDFAKWVKAFIPEDCHNLKRWYDLVSQRPSVLANQQKKS